MMLPGMYLPLDYWTGVVRSPASLGPKGGVRVTHGSAQRHLNNNLSVTPNTISCPSASLAMQKSIQSEAMPMRSSYG